MSRARRRFMAPSLAIRAAARAALVPALVGLQACSASNPAPASAEAGGGRFAVLGVGSADLPAAAFRAPDGSRAEFAPWETGDNDRLLIERGEPDARGRYTQQRWTASEGARTLAREQRLVAGADGSVRLAEEINHAEKVEVVFDPPLVVVPAALSVGSESLERARMTVHPIGDRARTRARGTVEQTIGVGPSVRVRTPAGEFVAVPLVSEFRADLGASKVQNRTETWLAPGVGIVAEQRHERTTALGVPIRNNRESWVLIEAPR